MTLYLYIVMSDSQRYTEKLQKICIGLKFMFIVQFFKTSPCYGKLKKASPLKFYSLQAIKFHSDSVKNESARRKKTTGGGVKHLPPSLFRVKSNLVSVLKNVLFLIVVSLRKFNELCQIKNPSLKYHMFTPSSCIDIRIRKFEFAGKKLSSFTQKTIFIKRVISVFQLHDTICLLLLTELQIEAK